MAKLRINIHAPSTRADLNLRPAGEINFNGLKLKGIIRLMRRLGFQCGEDSNF